MERSNGEEKRGAVEDDETDVENDVDDVAEADDDLKMDGREKETDATGESAAADRPPKPAERSVDEDAEPRSAKTRCLNSLFILR